MRRLASQLSLSMQKFPSALRHAEAVKELYKDLGASKEEVLELMHSVLKVHYLSADKNKAKEVADEAVSLAEQSDDKNVIAYAKLSSSVAYVMNKDLAQAAKVSREAAELFHESGDKMGQAKSMLHVSELELSQGDFKGAMAAAAESLDIRAELGQRKE